MLSMNAAFQTFLELPPLTPFSPSLLCCFPSLLGDHWAGCSPGCGAPKLCGMLSTFLWCSHPLSHALFDAPTLWGVHPPCRRCSLQCAHICVLRGMRSAGWLLHQNFSGASTHLSGAWPEVTMGWRGQTVGLPESFWFMKDTGGLNLNL